MLSHAAIWLRPGTRHARILHRVGRQRWRSRDARRWQSVVSGGGGLGTMDALTDSLARAQLATSHRQHGIGQLQVAGTHETTKLRIASSLAAISRHPPVGARDVAMHEAERHWDIARRFRPLKRGAVATERPPRARTLRALTIWQLSRRPFDRAEHPAPALPPPPPLRSYGDARAAGGGRRRGSRAGALARAPVAPLRCRGVQPGAVDTIWPAARRAAGVKRALPCARKRGRGR